jgi:hypothetical protein
MLHAVAIGLAVMIGWKAGIKFAKLFGFCLLLASPLNAQMWFGDTTFVKEQRPSRGVFYVDTLTYIGHKKVDPSKPWVYEYPAPLLYQDWWMQTAYCQGIRTTLKDFKRFRWFAVNVESFGTDSPLQIGFWGYFLPDSMALYIATRQTGNKTLVTHEMSHAFMHLIGEPAGHPPHRFGDFGCGFRYKPPT